MSLTAPTAAQIARVAGFAYTTKAAQVLADFFTALVTAIGSVPNWGAPVADLATLSALGATAIADKQSRMVENNGAGGESIYVCDLTSTLAVDGLNVVAATTGRWILAMQGGTGAIRVINKSGAPLTIGAYRVSGWDVAGSAFTVAAASPTSEQGQAHGCLAATLANNATGVLLSNGQAIPASGLNTVTSSVGAAVYYGAGGVLQLARPTGFGFAQAVATVETLAASGALRINVRPPEPLLKWRVGLHAGDGSDGAVILADQGVAPAGVTKTDNTPGATIFSLDRDLFCTTFAVSATVTLRQNGFRILASESVQVDGTLVNDGLPGMAGGAGGPAGTTGGGTAAGADKAGAGNGNAGTAGDPAVGGAGGAGGNSDGVPTETGGAAGAVTLAASRGSLRSLPQAALGALFGSAGFAAALGGTGGGSGGASAGSTGGAGGGGAGVGVVVSPEITISATGAVRAVGGDGKAGVGAAAGGGGGGGGGVLLLVADKITNAGTTSAAGGAGGAGAGTGIAGTAGSAGSVFLIDG